MSRKRSIMCMPTGAELAYFAGILDADGHFACNKSTDYGVTILMMDKPDGSGPAPVLAWAAEHIGGRLSDPMSSSGHGPRPRRMLWLTRAADLAFLLPAVLPYLVAKRDEARCTLLLARHSLARSQYSSPEQWRARRDLLKTLLLQARAERT